MLRGETIKEQLGGERLGFQWIYLKVGQVAL